MAKQPNYCKRTLTQCLIITCLSASSTACGLFNKEPDAVGSASYIPSWLIAPIAVTNFLPDNATVRDLALQASEYKRAFGECNARLDILRSGATLKR